MKTKLLATAILGVLASKLTNQETFSAFDVTKQLRDQVNAGEYTVSGVATKTNAYGTSFYDIQHGEVRQFVNELYRENLIPGYVQDFATGPQGSYKVFKPAQGGTNLNTTVTGTVVAIPSVAHALTNGAVGSISPRGVNALKDDLHFYIHTRLTANNPPTLKQIQSRFKGETYTCTDYATAVQALGFKVNVHPNAFSLSTVTL